MKKSLVIMSAMVLSGCFPGETEFTLKTSEIIKALRGEPAHISATMQTETVLSNAYTRVSFGNGKYTNQLDVVQSMLDKEGAVKSLDLGKSGRSHDMMYMWIEESDGTPPVFKAKMSVDILLATKPVLASLKGTTNSMELCVLEMDAKRGTIGDAEQHLDFNPRMCATASYLRGQIDAAELFLDKESEKEMMIVPMTALQAMFPTQFKEWTVEIIGDGPQIYVVAEDVSINGKTLKRYEGCIMNGDRVKMKLNKVKHKKDGGIQFMLDKPSA